MHVYTYPSIVDAISKINQLAVDKATHDKVFEEIKRLGISIGFTSEYRYYILLCGLFNSERNIVKFWKDYEAMFMLLI